MRIRRLDGWMVKAMWQCIPVMQASPAHKSLFLDLIAVVY